MLPGFAVDNVPDNLRAHTEFLGYPSLNGTTPDAGADLSDILLGQPCVAYLLAAWNGLKAQAEGVLDILRVRHPLKVVRTVVQLDSIKVVQFGPRRLGRK